MDHKTFSFKLTNLDFTGRTLEGYANVFDVKDLVGDIVHPGAFAKTLLERGGKVKFLWQHDIGEPIGRPVELREDANGLFIKAIISDTQRGRDALALLHDGAIGEMSIGFDTVKGGLDYSKDTLTGDTIRNLRELKLYEVSLVTFPANESAVVTGLKQEPSERKPWDVFPMDGQFCVYKLDEDGEQTGESLGCHDSEDEARQQVEALYANEKDLPGEDGKVMDEPEKGQKAGRVLAARNVTRLRTAMQALMEALADAGVMIDEDPAPDEDQAASDEDKPKDDKAGPFVNQTPTYEDLLALIEIETQQLDLMR